MTIGRKAVRRCSAADNALHVVNDHQSPQQFYTSWKNDALRFAWTGANWDGDGDLFIYLDTGAGGSTALYNPFPLGTDGQHGGQPGNATSVPIHLPAGFNASYVVWLQDATTASLLQWNGSRWNMVQSLDATQYHLDLTVSPPRSDVYLPISRAGAQRPPPRSRCWRRRPTKTTLPFGRQRLTRTRSTAPHACSACRRRHRRIHTHPVLEF